MLQEGLTSTPALGQGLSAPSLVWKQCTILEVFVTCSTAYEMLGDSSSSSLGYEGKQPGSMSNGAESCRPGSDSTDAPGEFISWG